MSKRAVVASRRDDRLGFLPLPAGFRYERILLTEGEVAEYARRRGKEAARKARETGSGKKARTRRGAA